jgi:hypothetical protein
MTETTSATPPHGSTSQVILVELDALRVWLSAAADLDVPMGQAADHIEYVAINLLQIGARRLALDLLDLNCVAWMRYPADCRPVSARRSLLVDTDRVVALAMTVHQDGVL